MTFHVVIPARYEASRLPGKPLVDIGGKPMIVHVAQRAAEAGAASVTVATDDARIVDAVQRAGFVAQMTDASHNSGSSRTLEVASAQGLADDALIVNVQGDEPLIPPSVIRQVATELGKSTAREVVTLCEPITDQDTLFDPNAVKVVASKQGKALYFSRAPIPFARDSFTAIQATGSVTFNHGTDNLLQSGLWARHIGVYGYRKAALARYMALPSTQLEEAESLEQLRFLYNDINVFVFFSCEAVPGGVDTPADLEAVRAQF